MLATQHHDIQQTHHTTGNYCCYIKGSGSAGEALRPRVRRTRGRRRSGHFFHSDLSTLGKARPSHYHIQKKGGNPQNHPWLCHLSTAFPQGRRPPAAAAPTAGPALRPPTARRRGARRWPGARTAAAAPAADFFSSLSLYNLGKARPMRVKREVNVIVCGLAHPA
jgi:hypothetical protein